MFIFHRNFAFLIYLRDSRLDINIQEQVFLVTILGEKESVRWDGQKFDVYGDHCHRNGRLLQQ